MKIRQKLLLTFTGLSLLIGLIGYWSSHSLRDITTDIHQVRKSSILELENSTEMTFEFLEIKSSVKEYIQRLIENDAAQIAIAKKDIWNHFTGFENQLELRRKATVSGLELYESEELEEENKELVKISYLENEYKGYKKNIIGWIARHETKDDTAQYKFEENELKKKEAILTEELKLFKNEAQNEITSEAFEMETKATYSTNLMLMIAALSLFVAVIAGIFISRSIVLPISKLQMAVQRVALGDMELIKNVTSRDEIGQLTVSFNKMTADLKESRIQREDYNNKLEQKVNERTKELKENIKRLKEAEEKLNHYASELKNSNLELEQFAYIASHDLQEPLRTTSNFAEVLQRQYRGKLDEKADEYFTYVLQSAERMRVLIKDLLDYSRIGRKKELARVDCNIVLQETLADLAVAINETHAEIKYAPLPVINGYPTEIKQLFQNLIINAIKFRIENVNPQVEVSVRKANGYWQFSVRDNGIGIDKKYVEKIFIIFQRLHSRSKYKGSGIGLAHCKKIVELHGGKIWVESEPGHGATFYFTIRKTTTDKDEE